VIHSRREFAQLLFSGLALTALPESARAQATGIKKAVLITMLPKELSYADKFALARAAGRSEEHTSRP
jgi:hypothetical protein